MPSFSYESIKRDGNAASGVLSAPDKAQAIRRLREQGMTPINIEQRESSSLKPAFLRKSDRPSIKRSDLANLVREIATALEAGLPLMQALKTVRQQSRGPAMPVLLDFLIERVEAGMPLHQAAAEYGPPFDDLVLGMFRSADASGKMDEVLHQLASLLDRSIELRREIVGATVYPLIVAFLILASVVVMVTVVLPRLMAPLTDQNNFVMPWPTAVLLGTADFIQAWWWLMLAITIAIVIGYRAWSVIPKNRRVIDGALLRIPLLGKLIRDVAVARFTRTLGTLVSAGIPILTALKIVRDTLGNTVLMDAIDEVQEKVTTGQSLADPLAECGHFPPLLVQIVNMGERSGRLESMLMHAARAFDRQVDQTLKVFTKALPPVLLVFMALLAAFVLTAILLPLLEMQSAIGA
ncbi:MAG: type II secretion system F family protein [Phycisphaerales bacterium]|nr:type II secretion system F family protein [Phycisphaerales bacterium]